MKKWVLRRLKPQRGEEINPLRNAMAGEFEIPSENEPDSIDQKRPPSMAHLKLARNPSSGQWFQSHRLKTSDRDKTQQIIAAMANMAGVDGSGTG